MELTREELDAAIGAAHQRGAKVRAHIANRNAMVTALSLGIDVVDHGDGLDEECIELFLKTGAFLVPSMLYPHRIAEMRPGAVADAIRAGEEQMLKILPVANKAGVKLLLGDDFGAVPLNHGDYAQELAYYVNFAGIPALDVLRWATRHGADLMGRSDELGAIRAGNLADFLVIDGNPLTDIKILQRQEQILAIVKGGKFEKDNLDILGTRQVRDVA
jgi:imidazolonepropionase-like amidohydrolase